MSRNGRSAAIFLPRSPEKSAPGVTARSPLCVAHSHVQPCSVASRRSRERTRQARKAALRMATRCWSIRQSPPAPRRATLKTLIMLMTSADKFLLRLRVWLCKAQFAQPLTQPLRRHSPIWIPAPLPRWLLAPPRLWRVPLMMAAHVPLMMTGRSRHAASAESAQRAVKETTHTHARSAKSSRVALPPSARHAPDALSIPLPH